MKLFGLHIHLTDYRKICLELKQKEEALNNALIKTSKAAQRLSIIESARDAEIAAYERVQKQLDDILFHIRTLKSLYDRMTFWDDIDHLQLSSFFSRTIHE